MYCQQRQGKSRTMNAAGHKKALNPAGLRAVRTVRTVRTVDETGKSSDIPPLTGPNSSDHIVFRGVAAQTVGSSQLPFSYETVRRY